MEGQTEKGISCCWIRPAFSMCLLAIVFGFAGVSVKFLAHSVPLYLFDYSTKFILASQGAAGAR